MLVARDLRKNYGSLIAVDGVNLARRRRNPWLCRTQRFRQEHDSQDDYRTDRNHIGRGAVSKSANPRDLPAYKRQIGYVPEEPNLYPYLTAREYLDMVGARRGMPRRQRLEKNRLSSETFFAVFAASYRVVFIFQSNASEVLLISGLLHNPGPRPDHFR